MSILLTKHANKRVSRAKNAHKKVLDAAYYAAASTYYAVATMYYAVAITYYAVATPLYGSHNTEY